MAKTNQKKRKNVKVDAAGEAHIQATFNNVIISLTNGGGQVISWSSAGKMGFKGSKKNTPYAAQVAAEDAAKEAHDFGLRRVRVYVKGPGGGFWMDKKKSETTIYELLSAVDGDHILISCLMGLLKCNAKSPCPMHDEYLICRNRLIELMKKTSIKKWNEPIDI